MHITDEMTNSYKELRPGAKKNSFDFTGWDFKRVKKLHDKIEEKRVAVEKLYPDNEESALLREMSEVQRQTWRVIEFSVFDRRKKFFIWDDCCWSPEKLERASAKVIGQADIALGVYKYGK